MMPSLQTITEVKAEEAAPAPILTTDTSYLHRNTGGDRQAVLWPCPYGKFSDYRTTKDRVISSPAGLSFLPSTVFWTQHMLSECFLDDQLD